MTLRCTAAAALLALALLAPFDAAAQREYRPLRHREIAASGAATAYEAVERLRSAWLWAGGDPASPAAAARVLVYVNGVRAGTLDALRGVTAAHVSSVRLVTPDHLRRMHPETVTMDVAGGMMVITDAQLARTRPERLRRLEVFGGMGIRGMLESSMADQLRELDYRGHAGGEAWRHEDGRPITTFGGAAFNLNRRLAFGLSYHKTGDALVRGTRNPNGPISNVFSTREVAALVSTGTALVRVGIGPAYRTVEYRQAAKACACADETSGTMGHVGGSAEVAFHLPIGDRFFGRVNLSARMYPRQELPSYHPSVALPSYPAVPALDMGGLNTFSGFSLGFRL